MAKPEEWLGKADAAALLRTSTRQLERRARQGYIEVTRAARGAKESAAAALYSRADILALKAGKPNIHAVAIDESPENGQNPGNKPTTNGALVAASSTALAGIQNNIMELRLAAYMEALRPHVPAPAPRPWLTLAEACDYSGLPASYLLAQARTGVKFAINVGTGSREYWRFHRDALGKVEVRDAHGASQAASFDREDGK